MNSSFLDAPGSPVISPRKLAHALKLSLGDLAAAVGVHRNTLTSRPQSPRVQTFLCQVVRVLATANEVCEEESVSVAWLLNESLPVFSGQTAFALIQAGRTDDVIAYLESLTSGFVG